MNPDAIREVLALHVAGHPLESVSFGATVTIICGNAMSAARWRSRTPDGVLPVSRVPVQVVEMGGAAMNEEDFGVGLCACGDGTVHWHPDQWVTTTNDHAPTCGDCAYVGYHCGGCGCCSDPVSRVQAIEAAEDHADQTAFDAWRERGL